MRAPKCDQAGQFPTHNPPTNLDVLYDFRELWQSPRFCLVVVKPKNPRLSPAAFCSVDYALLSVSHTMHSSGVWKGLGVPHLGRISPEHSQG